MQHHKLILLFAGLGSLLLLSGCHTDMWNQPRYVAYNETDEGVFANRAASRPVVEGVVARGGLHLDTALYEGKVGAAYVKSIPVSATAAFKGDEKAMLARGQNRYNVYCQPCHGATGDGNGFIMQRGIGYWQKLAASYHTDKLRNQPDGEIYHTIVNGKGVMYGYGSRVQDPSDRWAIVAYIRALEKARLANPTISEKITILGVKPVPEGTEGGEHKATEGAEGEPKTGAEETKTGEAGH
jgi:mono/diheme cytochrome c family protein